jgi:uncharacterized protein (DUF58 family)
MIVPEQRLLWLVAAITLPSGIAAAASPQWLWPAGILLVCATLDAILSRKRLRRVGIEMPGLLRFTRGRESRFELILLRQGDTPRVLRIGLVLPREVGGDEDALVSLDKGERFRVVWTVNPTRRGSYRIDRIMLEAPSAAGLWAVREPRTAQTEIRVYPNLYSDKKTASSLMMNRGAIGIHAQRQVGKGREFEKLRDYMPGDTYDDIHWRSTARHGRPVTKVFQVERTQEVYAVIDCSRLSGRDAGGESLIERYLSAALLLGLAVQNDGDLFGVIAFSDRIQRFVRAGRDRTHFGACRDALYTLTSNRMSPDFQELSRFVRMRLRKRALLVILTALDDPVISEEFERNVGMLRGKHLIITGIINPGGVSQLFSDASPENAGDIVDRLGAHLRWHKLNETQGRLRIRGIPLSLMQPDSASAETVAQYRQVKTKQLL